MIVNIRGTNGSGKSTVVRQLMTLSRLPARPLYGVLGTRRPEAYQLALPGVAKLVHVLGPYDVATGGCDAVQPFPLVLGLLAKYALRGHVVFEGSLVSDHWGKVGAFLEQYGRDAVLAFMPADLEECILRVQARRDVAGNSVLLDPKNTVKRYEAIQRVRAQVEAAGIVRTMTLPVDNPVQALREVLREAK